MEFFCFQTVLRNQEDMLIVKYADELQILLSKIISQAAI